MSRIASFLLSPWRTANTPAPRSLDALMACGLVRNMVRKAHVEGYRQLMVQKRSQYGEGV